jgi:hypothetical protein
MAFLTTCECSTSSLAVRSRLCRTGTPSSTAFSNLEEVRVGRRSLLLPPLPKVGEVASARSWRMTEGSLFEGDPSVSHVANPATLEPPPLFHCIGEDFKGFGNSR